MKTVRTTALLLLTSIGALGLACAKSEDDDGADGENVEGWPSPTTDGGDDDEDDDDDDDGDDDGDGVGDGDSDRGDSDDSGGDGGDDSGGGPGQGDDSSGDDPPPLPPPSEDCTFYFENAITDYDYGFSIYYLYVSPSTSPDWGPDQLGANILPFGGVFSLTSIPPGTYDVRVVDEFELTYSRYGIECNASDWYWEISLTDLD